MEFKNIIVQTKNRKSYVTLNRPEKRNALSSELVEELKLAFTSLEADTSVKVVILQGSGSAFCAGADLAYLQTLQANSYEENLQDSLKLKELFEQIYRFPKPVIAKVHGHAIAGGAGLATVCDFVYASDQVKYGYSEVRIGFVPAIVMLFLVRKIGESHARPLLLSAEMIDARRALDLGIFHRVLTPENLDTAVEELANQLIEGNSSDAMRLTKELLFETQQLTLSDGLELAAQTNAKARSTPDCQRGISAFLNKEKISW